MAKTKRACASRTDWRTKAKPLSPSQRRLYFKALQYLYHRGRQLKREIEIVHCLRLKACISRGDFGWPNLREARHLFNLPG